MASGRYMQSGDNVLFLGPPGVGKSHLAVALGMKACEQGVRTLFSSATALIAMLGKALAEGRLEKPLNILSQPQLLTIDEIGYLSIDRQSANLFFQLVSRRYVHGSIIITSNQSFGAWGEVFGDRDRQRHPRSFASSFDHDQHQRRSCRLKEKLKAGLLKPKLDSLTNARLAGNGLPFARSLCEVSAWLSRTIQPSTNQRCSRLASAQGASLQATGISAVRQLQTPLMYALAQMGRTSLQSLAIDTNANGPLALRSRIQASASPEACRWTGLRLLV
jgi:hypothetical protein